MKRYIKWVALLLACILALFSLVACDLFEDGGSKKKSNKLSIPKLSPEEIEKNMKARGYTVKTSNMNEPALVGINTNYQMMLYAYTDGYEEFLAVFYYENAETAKDDESDIRAFADKFFQHREEFASSGNIIWCGTFDAIKAACTPSESATDDENRTGAENGAVSVKPFVSGGIGEAPEFQIKPGDGVGDIPGMGDYPIYTAPVIGDFPIYTVPNGNIGAETDPEFPIVSEIYPIVTDPTYTPPTPSMPYPYPTYTETNEGYPDDSAYADPDEWVSNKNPNP